MINKKAMFFTLLTISILSLFLLSYTLYSVVQDRSSVNKRVETMNNYVFSLEQDLSRQLYISGYRIIFLFEKRITETGSYMIEMDSAFEEAFIDGTIYGETNEEIASIMNGAKFSDIQDSINNKAAKVNIDVSLSNPSFSMSQEDPWHIKVNLQTDLSITDKGNLASWNRRADISAYIPIENFEDPIYTVNTNAKVIKKINRTIYSDFVEGTDVSNLASHTANSYYLNSTDAPSFLDRLQGSLNANQNGVESLVYLPDLSKQGITTYSKSVVDHIYFSSSDPPPYNIQGMSSWFRLDNEHLSLYQVEGLTT